MDSLLQEITMLPGVLGCFVYTGDQQIAGSKMPPIFKENSIKTIGSLLSRTVQMGHMAQLDFKGIEFKFNESLLIINLIAKGALLVIVCEPKVNKSLITMTMGMLITDIEASMAKGIMTPAVTRQSAPPPPQPTPPAATQAPVKEAEIDATLAPILEQIKEALAMAIGPIAGPVMKDTIEIWAQQWATSRKNLPALAEMLCKEINDDELEKEFMEEFAKVMI
ncbi:MAG: hypothetical protein KKD01_19255 [Proteobacteria bacterium]|nr:hypothetical protein [Pseudomonadota bacterium]MBU1233233.1 hypothetical protein [Pseudomonadota bacterium]MBU1419051.1 hypothetical protein [Pseudomonadota bacterium]MBU1456860.1 hypothetical protein [Pseudomonadota bacterium]